jgi:hypothetical protein
VRCPTCGAKPREKCELHNGFERTELHPDRRQAPRPPRYLAPARVS